MLIASTSTYERRPFTNEAELEQVVLKNAELLFGPSIIVLPKIRINSAGGAGTIPDAYIINIETQEWYIVEAELGHHHVWEHIISQISKQLTAAEQPESRAKIIGRTHEIVQQTAEYRQLFYDFGIEDINIYKTLQNIILRPPIIAIPIDDVPTDLEIWARTVNRKVNIWLVQKFVCRTSNEVIYSIPDDAAPSLATNNGTLVEQPRSTKWFMWMLDNNLIAVGDMLTMSYKGHPFTGIVREQGIEVNGSVYSVSRAAIVCIQTVTPGIQNANGYIKWRAANGKYLDTIIQEHQATRSGEVNSAETA